MKKTILIAMMAVMTASTMIAQNDQKTERRGFDSEKRIEQRIQRLDKKLKLTDEQKLQLKEYYGEFDKVQKARMEEMRQQAKRDREALDGKINTILTDEQKAKFAELKEKMKDHMRKGHDGERGHGGKRGFGRGHGKGRGFHGGHGHEPGHGKFHGDDAGEMME